MENMVYISFLISFGTWKFTISLHSVQASLVTLLALVTLILEGANKEFGSTSICRHRAKEIINKEIDFGQIDFQLCLPNRVDMRPQNSLIAPTSKCVKVNGPLQFIDIWALGIENEIRYEVQIYKRFTCTHWPVLIHQDGQ